MKIHISSRIELYVYLLCLHLSMSALIETQLLTHFQKGHNYKTGIFKDADAEQM